MKKIATQRYAIGIARLPIRYLHATYTHGHRYTIACPSHAHRYTIACPSLHDRFSIASRSLQRCQRLFNSITVTIALSTASNTKQ